MHESRPLTNVNISHLFSSIALCIAFRQTTTICGNNNTMYVNTHWYSTTVHHIYRQYTDMYKFMCMNVGCVLDFHSVYCLNERHLETIKMMHEILEKATEYWLSKSTQYDIRWARMDSVSSKWHHTKGIRNSDLILWLWTRFTGPTLFC